MRPLFIGVLLSMAPLISHASDDSSAITFDYYGVEAFSWDEYNNDYGNQLGKWVSEYGPRFQWGTLSGTDWLISSGRFYRDRNDTTMGIVRYDGSLVDDTSYEFKHYTLYTAKDWSRQWGYRIPLSDTLSFSPTASLGLDSWIRALLPKKVPDPNNPGERDYAGAVEVFLEPYARLGMSLGMHLDDGYRLSLEAGKSRPLFTLEWHDEAGLLKPEANWNDYASLELSRYGKDGFFARLDYKDRIYDSSNLNSKGWFQPESHETTIGLTIGFRH